MGSRPFLLLDRDGTLIVEREYLSHPAGVDLVPGAIEALSTARDLGWGVAVVTNQSGIARGYFTQQNVEEVHVEIDRQLGDLALGPDAYFICPHVTGDACNCRKPAPGLGWQIAEHCDADLSSSIMVGDRCSDLGFGRAVGASTVLVRTGYGVEQEPEVGDLADYVVDDLRSLPRLMRDHHRVTNHLAESVRVKRAFAQRGTVPLVRAAEAIAEAMSSGHKLLICGNGGSAADSQHLAAEFVVRLSGDFEREALPAIALTVDSSVLTAAGNDYGFERVFSRQVEALGRPGDVLLAISTTGNSPNVQRAVELAKHRGMVTIGLLGGDGGAIGALVDHPVVVPSRTTQFVQESHLAAYHLLCAIVERRVTGRE